jgi:hypothetical protein
MIVNDKSNLLAAFDCSQDGIVTTEETGPAGADVPGLDLYRRRRRADDLGERAAGIGNQKAGAGPPVIGGHFRRHLQQQGIEHDRLVEPVMFVSTESRRTKGVALALEMDVDLQFCFRRHEWIERSASLVSDLDPYPLITFNGQKAYRPLPRGLARKREHGSHSLLHYFIEHFRQAGRHGIHTRTRRTRYRIGQARDRLWRMQQAGKYRSELSDGFEPAAE